MENKQEVSSVFLNVIQSVLVVRNPPPNKETLNKQKPQDCNCDVKLETSSI